MRKVYFATPVNGRKELTKQAKKQAALDRCIEVRQFLRQQHPDWIVTFSFNVCPIEDSKLPESVAMGRSVTLLMECDALVLDDGWMESAGCNVERCVAVNYNKRILTIGQAKLLQAKV